MSAQAGSYIFPDKYDIAWLHLEYPGSVLAHIHVSWLDPCKVRRTTIVGDKKMLVYDDVESLEKIKIYDKGVERPPYTDTFGDFQCSYRYGNITIPYIKFTEPLKIEAEHFAACIRNGGRPLSDGSRGLGVVRTLEAAQASAEKGGEKQILAQPQPAL
jgi:predicted dehydrogenase